MQWNKQGEDAERLTGFERMSSPGFETQIDFGVPRHVCGQGQYSQG